MTTYPFQVEARYITHLFHGAKRGLKQFVGSSFYTGDYDIAESYADMENGKVYEVAIGKQLNLMVFEAPADIDDLSNSEYLTDAVLDELDGAIWENRPGDEMIVVLFDRINTDGSITKLSLEEKRADIAASFRRYDR